MPVRAVSFDFDNTLLLSEACKFATMREVCAKIDGGTEALAAVPRLQRKHYESIPKSLKEMDFWTNFFTHLTVIVREAKPELLAGEPLDWKGVAPGDGSSSDEEEGDNGVEPTKDGPSDPPPSMGSDSVTNDKNSSDPQQAVVSV